MVMSDKMLDSLIENSFYKGFDSGMQTAKRITEKEMALLKNLVEKNPELTLSLIECTIKNILHEIEYELEDSI